MSEALPEVEAAYDQLHGPGPDYDYWTALVHRVAPADVCDLGRGTGMLTVRLAAVASGRTVGVDPDREGLSVARRRAGHEAVSWVRGHADDVSSESADMVVMTGHVSQVFLTDEAWDRVLTEIRRILRPGGVLSFDLRNPAARAWADWTPTASRRSVTTTRGTAAVWHEVTQATGDLVAFDTVTLDLRSGDATRVSDVLRFRDECSLRRSLARAGFEVVLVHGDSDGAPVRRSCPELLMTALRRS